MLLHSNLLQTFSQGWGWGGSLLTLSSWDEKKTQWKSEDMLKVCIVLFISVSCQWNAIPSVL